MKIELKEVTVREVAKGYLDSAEEGVVGYGGLLDIRPKYQREFVYDEKKRNAVIDTIRKSFPLNVMYWVVTDQETYEVMDGQQRTISFCQYVNGDFSVPVDGHPMAFHNLPKTLQDQILDYTLMIYFCSGTDKERLDWFRIINIAGERLTDQELRNAVYTGPWLTHAKSIFSKTGCPAYLLANKIRERHPDPPGLSADRHLLAVRRRHRAVHVGSPTRSKRQRTVVLLPGRHPLGGTDVHHIPQGDEGHRLGQPVQPVQGRPVRHRRTGE